MARKHHHEPQPGDDGFVPMTHAERRAHADALTRAHEGHQCAERADALCQAAEYYAIVGDHDLADHTFREALDIEDAEPGSVQAYYASFLLDRQRHPEAFAMIAEARKLHPEDPDLFSVIGEALAEHGYQQQAARWFTAGLVEQLGHLTDLNVEDLRHDFDLEILARGRYRARQALDLPIDHIDTMVQELRETEVTPASTH
ncbi:tetratricopeptide repeat protein [Hamadaea sp. NPDC051192]|uniref:tetratricopeptide repeat protein n=1 Tax=Hamadaea sp. NPDC051192 TaxID=3154940 RepID=UPI003433443A